MFYTYMLRCKDHSLYTGMTNDVIKRVTEHVNGNGAKYTQSHEVEKVEAVWQSKDKSLACKLEYQIKQLTKKQKEALVAGEKLGTYLKGKIDGRKYRRVEVEGRR